MGDAVEGGPIGTDDDEVDVEPPSATSLELLLVPGRLLEFPPAIEFVDVPTPLAVVLGDISGRGS